MPVDSNLKILLAEYDTPVRELMATALRGSGYEVTEALDGKAAIEIYKVGASRFNAILSDLKMPKISGVQFAEYNYKNKNLPFVVCTAWGDATLALKLVRFGVQDYIVKPINESHLLAVIKNAIRRSSEVNPETPEGNVGSIDIMSKRSEITLVLNWITARVMRAFSPRDRVNFLGYVHELLANSLEHGNLRISEGEKKRLLMEDRFEEEIGDREEGCQSKIMISLSVLANEVALSIKDEGDGFDYGKYLKMTEETLAGRLEMPNGRGIFMAKHYFDSIRYSDGGRSVQLVKSLKK